MRLCSWKWCSVYLLVHFRRLICRQTKSSSSNLSGCFCLLYDGWNEPEVNDCWQWVCYSVHHWCVLRCFLCSFLIIRLLFLLHAIQRRSFWFATIWSSPVLPNYAAITFRVQSLSSVGSRCFLYYRYTYYQRTRIQGLPVHHNPASKTSYSVWWNDKEGWFVGFLFILTYITTVWYYRP